MFYPKCPKCGSKTTTSTPYRFDANIAQASSVASQRFPPIALGLMVANMGYEVVKRTPIMEKVCTNESCGHRFK